MNFSYHQHFSYTVWLSYVWSFFLNNTIYHTFHFRSDPQPKLVKTVYKSLLLRVSPHENHASESTVHLTDFPQIWHTCVTSLVHQPGATVWFNCLLFWRNVNQTVRQWRVFKFEVKIYSMFDYLPQV